MGCCNLKIENTGMQANSSSLSIGKNSEFNEVCLDSLPKSEILKKNYAAHTDPPPPRIIEKILKSHFYPQLFIDTNIKT
jgi:hypothetical protein